ncbi:hypothetical protein L9F63_018538 [Diploptera punctata]|uniref:UNC93-like protein n=1 Tax=Diploptera punctata TaxID=6984 RepID=A0AAD8EFS3_DIPPU|nr:hypothetical protein L9F63_018538 [Diploptera punctata]
MSCQMAQVWGNLIPSVEFVQTNCGIYFCQSVAAQDPNFKRPSDDTVLFLVFTFLIILLLATVLVTYGIDSLGRYCEENQEGNSTGVYGLEIMRDMFKLLCLDRKLILLVPITVWLGLQQAFMNADFTASYISCAWGIRDVGYVMATYGITNAFSSLAIRWLVKITGRVPAIVLAFLMHLGIFATLYLWHPNSSNRMMFFIVTIVWGLADAIWVVQIISLYGILCPGKEEAAFSNYDLWLSLGFIGGFTISSMLCTDLKVYVMLGFLLVGMAAYIVLEWQRRLHK